MKNKLILIILLLPSCVQPSLVQQTKPNISASTNINNVQTTKVVESVKPQQVLETKTSSSQSTISIIESVKPSVIESDGNLNTKITDSTPIPSPTLTETPFPINTQPLYSPTVTPSSIVGRPATPCDAFGTGSLECQAYIEVNKPPTVPYSEIRPIPDGLTSGSVDITFKDEYKIRYKSSEGKFISLIGADISSINDLIITDKLSSTLYERTLPEELTQKVEEETSQNCNCDARNSNSMTFFSIKDTDVKAFILKLRANTFVREANYILPSSGGTGYTPTSQIP